MAADVLRGRKIAVPLRKGKDRVAHPFAAGSLISLAQKREQRGPPNRVPERTCARKKLRNSSASIRNIWSREASSCATPASSPGADTIVWNRVTALESSAVSSGISRSCWRNT